MLIEAMASTISPNSSIGKSDDNTTNVRIFEDLSDNSTISDSISNTTLSRTTVHHVSFLWYLILAFYVIGIFGNFLALIILAKRRNSRNSKYTLMLRCLAANNLIALLGMLLQMVIKASLEDDVKVDYYRVFCVGRVICRYFGLSSGCIAAVMAAERWMALARPFTYHKHITYSIIKKTIAYLINIAAVITFLPFLGFGIYHDPATKTCLRYRDATQPADIAYAYLFMVFGCFLCIMIVACNLFVTQVLCIIGRSKTRGSIQYDCVNREKGNSTLVHQTSFPNTSSDEIRFARLMTYLSISFVVCWMPQMIAIPLSQKSNPVSPDHLFFRIADSLIALHFTLDPYVYVLTRTKQPGIFDCFRKCRKGGMHRSQSVQSSKLRPMLDQTVDYGLNTS